MNDDAAFDLFLAALTPALPAIEQDLARRYQDAQLAEEAVNGCLTHLYLEWRQGGASLPQVGQQTWFRNRVQWRLLDELRRRNRHRPLTEEFGEDDEDLGYVVAVDEAARHEQAVTRQLVWESLQRLSDEDRLILESHFYDDRTDQETGTLLYGEEGTREARGLRVWRRRKRRSTYAPLADFLVEHGVGADENTPVAAQAV